MIYNCIVVFNKTKDQALFCKRRKDPYKGLYNFVGGKVEPGEAPETAAYRELYEETGITGQQIRLYRLMDIRYYHQGFDLQIYVGKLDEDVPVKEETNPLLWLPLTEDFTDKSRFAGEQNIAHIMNVALKYPIPEKTTTTRKWRGTIRDRERKGETHADMVLRSSEYRWRLCKPSPH